MASLVTVFAACIVIPIIYAAKTPDLSFGLNGNGDDFMSSFGSMVDSLAGAFDEFNKECTFTCPKSKQVIKPRTDHVPTSNGCGSYGMALNTEKLPKMTKCCDSHDICYDTCNSNKESCDRNFKQCLENMCHDMADSLSHEEFEGCEATAELMYQGTAVLGCNSFKEAQQNACECVISNQKLKEKLKPSGNGEL
ncbi:group XIIA secretory phospholipase A2-like [Argopecten irradians]|uniref:group XIIA secretory phospholipase A2-like n=1 Tax=Argopecten irradians TaxID=31199 RepID=UPI00371AD544